MSNEPDIVEKTWSGLTPGALLDESGMLSPASLFSRSNLPQAELPAERVIEQLARVPGSSQYGRHEALRDLLADSTDPDATLEATIADAARKLATLSNAVDEVIDTWEQDRWATLERILTHERELLALRAHLRNLPTPDTDAPKLRQAARIAREELAGLIGILDHFRLTRRQEQAVQAMHETSDAPAFTQADNVLRLLQSQQERKKAA